MFATPQQGERWSDLMPFLTWELWLARPMVADRPLPWQKPLLHLPPGRVCQGMSAILTQIGTPTRVCKPRGKSPGWARGRPRAPRPRYDLIRSEQWKTIRSRRKAKTATDPPKRGRPKRDSSPATA